MRRIREAIGTFILTNLVIIVFIFTLYLCLEFFGIIQVPEERSLVKFLYAKMDLAVSVVPGYVENTLKDTNLKEIFNKDTNSIAVELDENTVTTVQLQEDQNENIKNSNNMVFRYYDQLDQNAKIMYDALESNKDKLKSGNHVFNFGTTFDELLHQENGNEILNQSFQLAVNSFSFDHPEIFYIDITKIYLLTEETTTPFSKTYRVSIGPNEASYLYEEYTSESDVNFAVNQVNQIKDSIKQNAQGSNYDKIKYVHDYLIDATEYEKNVETHNNYNIYGAMVQKKAVCEGYSKAYKFILDELEIPCFIVCGTGQNSSGEIESHAWNYVQLDNNLYAVDVTWDDPVIIGNGIISNDFRYKYFLKGSDNFFDDHIEDGTIIETAKFTYPRLNNLDY